MLQIIQTIIKFKYKITEQVNKKTGLYIGQAINSVTTQLRNFWQTRPHLKSSAIMMSFFASQKSSINCQQITTVKFKKHNKTTVTPFSFYAPLTA